MDLPQFGEAAAFLRRSEADLLPLSAAAFDEEKKCWIPDEKNAYIEAEVKRSEGDGKIIVETRHGKTNSGIFCVTINPYKWLPVCQKDVVAAYKRKRLSEAPPHIFAVAENAFQDMLHNLENQSLLFTGESGAWKTVNSKFVLQYFTTTVAMCKSRKKPEILEAQIMQVNPILEASGNAKTLRNDNSSRFGKFIRLHFDARGVLSSADIEIYLLEKSRLTYQQMGERNFHIFYQMIAGKKELHGTYKVLELCHSRTKKEKDQGLKSAILAHLLAKCILYAPVALNPSDVHICSRGVAAVDSPQDTEQLLATEQAMDSLGFLLDEKCALYKLIGAIMHLGNMKFKQKPREEQLEADGTSAEKASFLMGINSSELVNGLICPRIKVGNEFVTKSQNIQQPCVSINFTNEKLQQYFNHMFILEQEEYRKESIDWVTIDFGLDLQSCLDLTENPMGLFSILEEACMLPKASEMILKTKLFDNHFGKSTYFQKPKSDKKDGGEVHFELVHYAGVVPYTISGWLEKNKDHLNGTVEAIFQMSSNRLLARLFENYISVDNAMHFGEKKHKKGASFQLVTSLHKENLNKLMTSLKSTVPHFVRCINPNVNKMPGIMDPFLVLQQLRCNRILEGIKICYEGFPNRMLYDEFKQRYYILNPRIFPKSKSVSSRKATEELLSSLEIDHTQYQFGITKVFFKASFLGGLEKKRDKRLSEVFTLLQARARGKLIRIKFQKTLEERDALLLIQCNIRAFMATKNWPWMRLFFKIKPLIKTTGMGEVSQLKEKYGQLQKALGKSEAQRELKVTQISLIQEKNDLLLQLQAEQVTLADTEEQCQSLIKSKIQLEARVKELSEPVEGEEEINSELIARGRKLEDECSELKKEIDDLETILAKSEKEKHQAEHKVKNLTEEVESLNEEITKVHRATEAIKEAHQQTQNCLQIDEEKLNTLSKANLKLEQQVVALEDAFEERKARMNCERERHRLEEDLKSTQHNVENMESSQQQLAAQMRKKELEMSQMYSRVESEKGLVAELQKKVKELQTHIGNLNEELETERTTQAKIEIERADLTQDLEDLNEKLEEAGGASLVQLEITRKQEARFQKLRQNMEEATLHFETTFASLKKRHADSLAELKSQVENLQLAKQNLEQEKSDLQLQVGDLQTHVEQMARAKANADKFCSLYEGHLNEANTKLNEMTQLANDMTAQKTKLQSESGEFLKRLEEKEILINQLSREKRNCTQQIEELRGQLQEETRCQSALAHALQSAKHDFDLLREQYEEEQEFKAKLHQALCKGNTETVQWRLQYEYDVMQRTEDLECARKKLAIRLQEAAEAMTAVHSRNASLERTRHQLQLQLGDALSDLEKARSVASALEQKQQHTDQALADWKQKEEESQALLAASQEEARALNTEILKLKHAYEESIEGQETLRRENKSLQEQIAALTSQVKEVTKNLSNMEKVKKLIEQEKIEAQVTLEETEGALERNESKIVRFQLELLEAKAELEKKLSEKEEEIENFRSKQQCAMDSLQSCLDSEARNRIEATRVKKKMEGDLKEMELQLCAANRQVSHTTKSLGLLQRQMKDLQGQLDDSIHLSNELKEQVTLEEQRNSLLQSELEELRCLQEQTERGRRLAEKELLDVTEKINLFHTQNLSLLSQKKKLEDDVARMQKETEEMIQQCQKAEEKAKKAAIEAANMSEELKKVQDTNTHMVKMKMNMEQTIKDLQKNLDEAEQMCLLGSRKQIQKLESRVRELEGELDGELCRKAEAQREARRLERGVKELTLQTEEDKKNLSRMQTLVDKLQLKVQSYKQQVEAAETQANQYLLKYKKQQHELNEMRERAETAESQVNKLKIKAKDLEKKEHLGVFGAKVTLKSTNKSPGNSE
ncbi:LOW QUALITY PROTEIN: myosin-15 [Thomomys bottae]